RNDSQRRDRHVLEFISHHRAVLHERGQGGAIVPGGAGEASAHFSGYAGGFRRIDMAAVAQLCGGHGQHSAELAAAENADRRAWRNHAQAQAGRSATARVWAARNACSRPASSGSATARIAAASSPALVAPGSPIASVPTGIPAGICTIDSSESWPFSAFDSTGTPSTGRWVIEATIPGRCAAPPAPAMITLKPSSAAPWAKAKSRSGVRWAETIRASYATSSWSSAAAAQRMVGQSDWLPMTIATGAPISAVLQVVAFAGLQRLVELVDDRLPGRDLQPGDVLVGDRGQVLDQRAQRIAVRRHDHGLTRGQFRPNGAFPVREHALDGQLQ